MSGFRSNLLKIIVLNRLLMCLLSTKKARQKTTELKKNDSGSTGSEK